VSKKITFQYHVKPVLMRWYRRSGRNLPWRQTRDPYRIWISEVMLQQTQVETVIPYYRRFLKRFPTVEILARARRDSVFHVWQGLGYYRRAQQLHEAARVIVRRHNGQLPHRASELIQLPGFGPYTSGAVASIAFDEAAPAIDGNVIRVISRLFHIRTPISQRIVRERIEPVVRAMIPRRSPGEFNQALMELGAVVCRPKTPKCSICPVRHFCQTRSRGRNPEEIPLRQSKPRPTRAVPIAIGVILKEDRILIAKRPDDTILGGLWEFPGGKKENGESIDDACIREIREETGLTVRIADRIDDFVHHYSHYSVHLHFFDCRVKGGRLRSQKPLKWIRLHNLTNYAFPAANQRIIKKLLNRHSD
jgi:A/G-specific adenine glycosylase